MKKHKTDTPAGDLNVSAPDHIKKHLTRSNLLNLHSIILALPANTKKTHIHTNGVTLIIPPLGEYSSVFVHHLHRLIDPSHVKSVFDQQQLLVTATSLLPEMQHFKNKDVRDVLIWTKLWIECTHTHTNTNSHIYKCKKSTVWPEALRHCASPVCVTAMYKPNIELYCLPLFLQKWKWKNKTIIRYMHLVAHIQ